METSESVKRDTIDERQSSASSDKTSSSKSSTATRIGVTMIVASLVLSLLDFTFAYDVAALAWGAIIVALGQYFQHKENMLTLEIHKKYLHLEREKELQSYRLSLMEKVLPNLPSSDLTIDNVQALLREEPVDPEFQSMIEDDTTGVAANSPGKLKERL